METQYQFMNKFLDVSQFVLTSLPQSDQDNQNFTPEEYAEKISNLLIFSILIFSSRLIQESSSQIEKLSNIDFLTPYICYVQYNHDEEIDNFQLQQNQQNSLQQEIVSDQQDSINIWNDNRDLLDMIQQQYQQIHKMNILNQEKQSISLNLKIEFQNLYAKSEIQSTLENSSSEQLNTKYYNYLSYKENNIQFFNERNTKYYNQTRKEKVQRYFNKKLRRNWKKKISYHCRKQVADARLRVKGRFITRIQANKLLGINTWNLSVEEIKNLLEIKFQKQDPQNFDSILLSSKEQ